MKLGELRKIMEGADDDLAVVINCTFPHSTVGASPTMPVVNAGRGFDWNHGQFFLHPEKTLYTDQEKLELKAKAFEQIVGWHMAIDSGTASSVKPKDFPKLVANIIKSYENKAAKLT